MKLQMRNLTAAGKRLLKRLTPSIWTSHRNRRRRLTGYGCRRCGYAPRASDIIAGSPYPCPICGQPLYESA